MSDKYRHFSSSRSFHAWLNDNMDFLRQNSSGWSHGRSALTAGIKTLRDGNAANIPAAQKLLNEFRHARLQVPAKRWHTSIVGSTPNVPAYVAGTPNTMWARRSERSDRTPLRVFVGLTSSGGIEEDALMRRGVALAAFAMAMSNVRPVTVTPYVNLADWGRRHNSLISWDIPTAPLVLSVLIGNLSDPNVTRHVGIPACRLLNPLTQGSWHRDFENEAAMRAHLGAKPADLYLPSIYLFDPILSDPLGWIKDKLAHYAKEK